MSNLFKYTLLAIIFITLSIEGNAQVQNVLDGAYVKETNLTKRVIPYPYLREADVMYFRRIWQEMDLKQKINHPYYYPVDPIEDRSNLFDVIRDGLLIEGSLVAYSTGPVGDEDEFTIPLSILVIHALLSFLVLSSSRVLFKALYRYVKCRFITTKNILIYGIK